MVLGKHSVAKFVVVVVVVVIVDVIVFVIVVDVVYVDDVVVVVAVRMDRPFSNDHPDGRALCK